ncbi:TIGR01777 family oxidoreductase [Spiractinospora alimapuensis]|uniref:TIGR01777 family oxidoreductase n=1 Tax=Spiractinospora alimapuensis TaxID=2820884 RepID=UPI001F1B491B|nr:TIGR01777 family oxidoreductase [Spiractinospora alimapuensis]QVQ53260.1 TIGR01777 family oxidoreductase [Spiractinospora alimapuensis]
MRVAITGASGFIGTALRESLRRDGHEVLRLVRGKARAKDEVGWDPEAGDVDSAALVGTDAVVHLAGAPLGPRRWTAEHKRRIRLSRTRGTRTLAEALAAMDSPPPRMLSASAVGFYGDTGSVVVDESAPRGSGFLSEVVADWEAATEPAAEAGVSVAHTRTGVVLSTDGGLMGTVLPLFRLGLGGRLGSGRQYMSWIAETDEIGAMRFLLERPDLTGPFNLTAPEPVTNAEYTRMLAAALRRPAPFTVPAGALRLALGGFADEAALVSQRVVPARLREAGYTFRDPALVPALAALLR